MPPSPADFRDRLDTLDNDEFSALCQDHFPSVHKKFTAGMTRGQMTGLLLDYVTRKGEAARLAGLLGNDSPPATPRPPTPEVTTCDVLILAANPLGTRPVDLDAAADLVKARLAEGVVGARLRVRYERAVAPDDVSRLLLKHNPLILHFSGHGSRDGDLLFQGPGGIPAPLPVTALADMVAAVRGRLECVVLNACYTLQRAEPLAERVLCVVGTSRAFDEEAAARFAAGFYRGLAFGKSYAVAFDLGRADLRGLRLPDDDVPHLLSRRPEVQDPDAGPGRLNLTDPIASRRPGARGWWYPLWYGTHRRPDGAGYGPERDDALHLGTCRVLVPRDRPVGVRPRSLLDRLRGEADPGLRLDRKSVKALEAEAFWADVRAAVAETDAGDRTALVFIHGFNVSFEDAALRAAQIGFDLQVPSLTAFYSWPSRGHWSAYTMDEATAGASYRHLAEFLAGFASRSDAERVHVIAHSMGNRVLLRCLNEAIVLAGREVPFGQVFLAAPDVDAGEFLAEAAVCRRAAARTTLYASDRDRALAVSEIVHGYDRAGYLPPVTVVDDIDTVSVGDVDLHWLGHSAYGDSRAVLTDVRDLMLHGTEPEKRLGLTRAETREGRTYWTMRP